MSFQNDNKKHKEAIVYLFTIDDGLDYDHSKLYGTLLHQVAPCILAPLSDMPPNIGASTQTSRLSSRHVGGDSKRVMV